LTSAQSAGTNCSQMTVNGKTEYWGNSYGYDPWGNLLQKTVTKCSAENLSVSAFVNNQLSGYSYDAAGNMTHDATTNTNYSFDQENRITGAGGYTYTYDADGNRVEKSNGSTGTIYWYMSPGIVAESDLTGAPKSEYVFFYGERVARKDFSGSTTSVFYYFSDHLKTASVITDSSGTIKADSDYYPWGGELQFVNNDSNHYKFTGKERDSETGLDYFGARYYGNWLGRWMTPDWSMTPVPVPYADLGDPQSLNQYSYVRNVPTSRADSDGHDTWNWVKTIVQLTAAFWDNQARHNRAAFAHFMTSGPPPHPATVPAPNCTSPSTGNQNNQNDNNKQNSNNSYQQNTKADQLKANAQKGAASEQKVLNDKGLAKNTEKVSGTEGKSIPDYNTESTMGEIKDAQSVSNTKQLRIQKEAAQNNGQQHELVTGTNTNVTDNAAQGTKVIRRDDLGPKKPPE